MIEYLLNIAGAFLAVGAFTATVMLIQRWRYRSKD